MLPAVFAPLAFSIMLFLGSLWSQFSGKDFTEGVSVVVNIAMAVTAMLALGVWKQQIDYQRNKEFSDQVLERAHSVLVNLREIRFPYCSSQEKENLPKSHRPDYRDIEVRVVEKRWLKQRGPEKSLKEIRLRVASRLNSGFDKEAVLGLVDRLLEKEREVYDTCLDLRKKSIELADLQSKLGNCCSNCPGAQCDSCPDVSWSKAYREVEVLKTKVLREFDHDDFDQQVEVIFKELERAFT